MNILYFDIETTPIKGYTWGAWEQNVIHIIEDWRVLGAAYAFGDEKTILSYPSREARKAWPENPAVAEYQALYGIHSALDHADIVVAHNGDKFDIRKLNARFIQHGFDPPSPYVSIDTLKIARKHFAFTKNRLDDLGKLFELGGKQTHTGFKMWLEVMDGRPKAWKQMMEYNRRDVDLLRDIYKQMRPWVANHPNVAEEAVTACPNCGSYDLQSRGERVMKSGMRYHRYRCSSCGAWSRASRSRRGSSPNTRS